MIYIVALFFLFLQAFAQDVEVALAEMEEDPRRGMKMLHSIGSAPSEYELGLIYEEGRDGVPPSLREAYKHFLNAASDENPPAQYKVGYYLKRGKGMKQDIKASVPWLMKSAKQGYVEAQIGGHHDVISIYFSSEMGISYHVGDGVPKDMHKAKKWYEMAAAQEHGEAYRQLAILQARGEGGYKADRAAAHDLMEKGAHLGSASCQCHMGRALVRGDGYSGRDLPKDEKAAFDWYMQSAQQGYDECVFQVANCYAKGIGVVKDELRAVHWLSKVKQGSSPWERAQKLLKTLKKK